MGLKDEVKKVEGEIKIKIEDAEAKISAETLALYKTIDAWFAKHFHNTKLGAHTEYYNMAHAAKEDLKAVVTPPAAPIVVSAPPAPASSAPPSTAQ